VVVTEYGFWGRICGDEKGRTVGLGGGTKKFGAGHLKKLQELINSNNQIGAGVGGEKLCNVTNAATSNKKQDEIPQRANRKKNLMWD